MDTMELRSNETTPLRLICAACHINIKHCSLQLSFPHNHTKFFLIILLNNYVWKKIGNAFFYIFNLYSHFFPTHSEEGENVKLSPITTLAKEQIFYSVSLRNGRYNKIRYIPLTKNGLFRQSFLQVTEECSTKFLYILNNSCHSCRTCK